MDYIPYEESLPPEENLPLRILFTDHDSGEPGCEFHWHERLEFYYICSGGVLLACQGQQEWLYPGDIGFVNWCRPHRGLDFKDGTRHCVIQFDLDLFENEMHLADRRSYASLLLEHLSFSPIYIRQDEKLNALFGQIVQEYQEKAPGYELALKGLLYGVMTHLLRITRAPDTENSRFLSEQRSEQRSLEHVKQVLLYLSAHYSEPEMVRLPVIANTFGLSCAHLCRIFKQHTGRSVITYLNELRCTRAAVMIQNGTPLSEVCTRIGISDYNYFSRIFKQQTGFPPSHYRNKK